MEIVKNNCKECPSRTIDCHVWCEDYKRFRKELDIYNEKQRNEYHETFSPHYREGWALWKRKKR